MDQNVNDLRKERSLLEDLINYISIMYSYRWLIILISSIAIVCSVAFTLISKSLPSATSPLPNIYESHAALILQQEENDALSALAISLGLVPQAESSRNTRFDNAELAIKVLRTPNILDALAEEFNIAEKYGIVQSIRTSSREAVLSNSDFAYDSFTGTITISFKSIDPVFSRDMVLRMVELLDEWFSLRGGFSRQRKKNMLEDKLSEISIDISRLELQIRDFQEKYGVLTVEELAASQARLLSDLRSQLIIKEMEIKNYTQFSKIEDPVAVKLKSESDNLAALINRIESGYENPSGTVMPAKKELPNIANRIEKLFTDLAIQRKIYVALSQQVEFMRLSIESESLFQVLEAPEISDKKSGPSRGKLCILVVFLSFCISIILCLVLNSISKIKINPRILRRITSKV